MRKIELAVIIVNYNTAEAIKRCLESIRRWAQIPGLIVVVVDNHSSDSSVSVIKKFAGIKLIQNKRNLGFAKAANQGIKAVRANYYFLLNPDAQLTAGALQTLINFAKNCPKLAAVGPKLLNPDGSSQASCYNLPSIKNAIWEYWLGRKGAYGKFTPPFDHPVEVEAVVGAAMLIPKAAIDKIGLFDEKYFMYYEDLDWCRRAKKTDLKIFWHPKARIIHEHGSAAKKIGSQAYFLLRQSSKIYHGVLKYHLLTAVLWLGQRFRAYSFFALS